MRAKGNRLKLFIVVLITLLSVSIVVMITLSFSRYQEIGNHFEQIKESQQ